MYTQKISFLCHSKVAFAYWWHSSFSIFYCILFHYITVLKTFLFFSLKACKQFVKSDENVSPILTKTDRHSGLYFVCCFYFHIMSWLSVEMGFVCDPIQYIVHGHIHLHILWECMSESGISLPFILQFNVFCKHLENVHNFHTLFAQNAQNEFIVGGHIFLYACFISEASTLVSFTYAVDFYTENCW